MTAAAKKTKTRPPSLTASVAELLAQPGGTFTLKRRHPRSGVIHQAVSRLRSEGYDIVRESTPEGTLYRCVSVPAAERKPDPAPNGLTPHPGLGTSLRVTSLGEHPSGRVIVGLRDPNTGDVWLTAVVKADDL